MLGPSTRTISAWRCQPVSTGGSVFDPIACDGTNHGGPRRQLRQRSPCPRSFVPSLVLLSLSIRVSSFQTQQLLRERCGKRCSSAPPLGSPQGDSISPGTHPASSRVAT